MHLFIFIVGIEASPDKKRPRTFRGGRSGLASGEWGFEVAFIYLFSTKNRLSSRATVMMCWVGHELGAQTRGSEQEKAVLFVRAVPGRVGIQISGWGRGLSMATPRGRDARMRFLAV